MRVVEHVPEMQCVNSDGSHTGREYRLPAMQERFFAAADGATREADPSPDRTLP